MAKKKSINIEKKNNITLKKLKKWAEDIGADEVYDDDFDNLVDMYADDNNLTEKQREILFKLAYKIHKKNFKE